MDKTIQIQMRYFASCFRAYWGRAKDRRGRKTGRDKKSLKMRRAYDKKKFYVLYTDFLSVLNIKYFIH